MILYNCNKQDLWWLKIDKVCKLNHLVIADLLTAKISLTLKHNALKYFLKIKLAATI